MNWTITGNGHLWAACSFQLCACFFNLGFEFGFSLILMPPGELLRARDIEKPIKENVDGIRAKGHGRFF